MTTNDKFAPIKTPNSVYVDGKEVFRTISMAELYGVSDADWPRFVWSFSYDRDTRTLQIRLQCGDVYRGFVPFGDAINLLTKYAYRVADDALLARLEKVDG